MSQPAHCHYVGCSSDAYWLPVLVMRPIGDQTLARAELDIPLCHAHKKLVVVKDLLTDQGWENMSNFFSAQGKLMPDRDSIVLDFKHVENGYYC